MVITLVIEARTQKRARQIHVMRMLLNTRDLVSDPNYSIAINLVPVEFNHDKKIMKSWETYIEKVRSRPTPEGQNEHSELLKAKQTALIYQIMSTLGFKLSETDIQTSGYIAQGFVARDELYLDSLRAMRDIAELMKTTIRIYRSSKTIKKSDGCSQPNALATSFSGCEAVRIFRISIACRGNQNRDCSYRIAYIQYALSKIKIQFLTPAKAIKKMIKVLIYVKC